MNRDTLVAVDDRDRKGVLVPFWAIAEAPSGTSAIVFAQITWLMQPNQREGKARSEQLIERDGELWLYMTDEELAASVHMNAGAVRRARRALVTAGMLLCQSRSVGGKKVTLMRHLPPVEHSSDPTNASEPVPTNASTHKPEPARPNVGSDESQKRRIRRMHCPIENLEDSKDLAADAADPDLDGGPSRAPTDPLKAKAHDLAVLAFEQPVKPVLREDGKHAFPAVMALIESHLQAGHVVGDIEAAIRAGVGVWSKGGLSVAISKAKEQRFARSGSEQRRLDAMREVNARFVEEEAGVRR